MKKTIFESNCFTDELLKCTPEISSTGAVKLGSHFISTPNGKIKSAMWNSDGALVCVDENGTKHFFVGTQREFMAYGDETSPHDSNAYKAALKENNELRNQSDDDEKEAKKERKKSKKSNASRKICCGFCSIFKCLLKTLLNLLCLGAIIDSMDD